MNERIFMFTQGKNQNYKIDLGEENTQQKESSLEKAQSYKDKLSDCEALFGPLSGEVGLLLISMQDFYSLHGDSQTAFLLEKRIQSIVDHYRLYG